MTRAPTLFAAPRRANRGRGLTLHVEIVTKYTAVVHGERLVALIAAAQIDAKVWDPSRRAWTISRRRVDDLIALAELEGRVVTVEDVS